MSLMFSPSSAVSGDSGGISVVVGCTCGTDVEESNSSTCSKGGTTVSNGGFVCRKGPRNFDSAGSGERSIKALG